MGGRALGHGGWQGVSNERYVDVVPGAHARIAAAMGQFSLGEEKAWERRCRRRLKLEMGMWGAARGVLGPLGVGCAGPNGWAGDEWLVVAGRGLVWGSHGWGTAWRRGPGSGGGWCLTGTARGGQRGRSGGQGGSSGAGAGSGGAWQVWGKRGRCSWEPWGMGRWGGQQPGASGAGGWHKGGAGG